MFEEEKIVINFGNNRKKKIVPTEWVTSFSDFDGRNEERDLSETEIVHAAEQCVDKFTIESDRNYRIFSRWRSNARSRLPSYSNPSSFKTTHSRAPSNKTVVTASRKEKEAR